MKKRTLPLLLLLTMNWPTSVHAWGGICDAPALTSALAAASSGDVVQVGACTITGTFNVPAGVTLRGVNSYFSAIAAPLDSDGLRLAPGTTAAPTSVQRLRVENDGGMGIYASGAGSVWVHRVRVETDRGIGIGIEDVDAAAITSTHVRGPVTAANKNAVDIHTSSLDTATHGIALVRIADASVDGVTTRGFTNFGILAVECDTAFWGVISTGNVGVGVGVSGGSADLDFVGARRTYSGIRPVGDYPAGIVIGGGAAVTSTGLSSTRSEGFGIFEQGSSSDHDWLAVRYNDHAGIWAQSATSLQVDRATAAFNDFANIVAVDSAFASVSRSAVNFAQEAAPAGFVLSGDGVQLVNTPGALDDVALIGNERAGFLGDLGPTMNDTDIAFDGVLAVGFGSSYGAILQQAGAPLAPPDVGITRFGAVSANDLSFSLGSTPLDPAGGVVPCFFPQMEALVNGNLIDLFDPLI